MTRTRRIVTGLLVLATVAVVAGTVAFFLGRSIVMNPVERFDGEVVVDIPPGFTSTEIVDRLVEYDVIGNVERYEGGVGIFFIITEKKR